MFWTKWCNFYPVSCSTYDHFFIFSFPLQCVFSFLLSPFDNADIYPDANLLSYTTADPKVMARAYGHVRWCQTSVYTLCENFNKLWLKNDITLIKFHLECPAAALKLYPSSLDEKYQGYYLNIHLLIIFIIYMHIF